MDWFLKLPATPVLSTIHTAPLRFSCRIQTTILCDNTTWDCHGYTATALLPHCYTSSVPHCPHHACLRRIALLHCRSPCYHAIRTCTACTCHLAVWFSCCAFGFPFAQFLFTLLPFWDRAGGYYYYCYCILLFHGYVPHHLLLYLPFTVRYSITHNAAATCRSSPFLYATSGFRHHHIWFTCLFSRRFRSIYTVVLPPACCRSTFSLPVTIFVRTTACTPPPPTTTCCCLPALPPAFHRHTPAAAIYAALPILPAFYSAVLFYYTYTTTYGLGVAFYLPVHIKIATCLRRARFTTTCCHTAPVRFYRYLFLLPPTPPPFSIPYTCPLLPVLRGLPPVVVVWLVHLHYYHLLPPTTTICLFPVYYPFAFYVRRSSLFLPATRFLPHDTRHIPPAHGSAPRDVWRYHAPVFYHLLHCSLLVPTTAPAFGTPPHLQHHLLHILYHHHTCTVLHTHAHAFLPTACTPAHLIYRSAHTLLATTTCYHAWWIFAFCGSILFRFFAHTPFLPSPLSAGLLNHAHVFLFMPTVCSVHTLPPHLPFCLPAHTYTARIPPVSLFSARLHCCLHTPHCQLFLFLWLGWTCLTCLDYLCLPFYLLLAVGFYYSHCTCLPPLFTYHTTTVFPRHCTPHTFLLPACSTCICTFCHCTHYTHTYIPPVFYVILGLSVVLCFLRGFFLTLHTPLPSYSTFYYTVSLYVRFTTYLFILPLYTLPTIYTRSTLLHFLSTTLYHTPTHCSLFSPACTRHAHTCCLVSRHHRCLHAHHHHLSSLPAASCLGWLVGFLPCCWFTTHPLPPHLCLLSLFVWWWLAGLWTFSHTPFSHHLFLTATTAVLVWWLLVVLFYHHPHLLYTRAFYVTCTYHFPHTVYYYLPTYYILHTHYCSTHILQFSHSHFGRFSLHTPYCLSFSLPLRSLLLLSHLSPLPFPTLHLTHPCYLPPCLSTAYLVGFSPHTLLSPCTTLWSTHMLLVLVLRAPFTCCHAYHQHARLSPLFGYACL